MNKPIKIRIYFDSDEEDFAIAYIVFEREIEENEKESEYIQLDIRFKPNSNIDKSLEKENINRLLQMQYDKIKSEPYLYNGIGQTIQEMIDYPGDYVNDAIEISTIMGVNLPEIISKSNILQNKTLHIPIQPISSENHINIMDVLEKLKPFNNLKYHINDDEVSFEEFKKNYELLQAKNITNNKRETSLLTVSYDSKQKRPIIKDITEKIGNKLDDIKSKIVKEEKTVQSNNNIENKIYIDDYLAVIYTPDSSEECEPNQLKELLNSDKYKDKEFILKQTYDIDDPKLIKVINLLEGIENIKIKLKGNQDYASIKDCKYTIDYINNMVNQINQYDLSPIEKAMFAYDLVRDRVYKKEEKDESTTESRDITKIIIGDKIVCAGYAKLYQVMLKKLGINGMTNLIGDKFKNVTHLRNIAYIKDDKYGLDGIYQFDPTWDSKRIKQSNFFLYSYNYFGLRTETMNSENLLTKKYYDYTLNGYSYGAYIEGLKILKNEGITKLPLKTLEFYNTIEKIVTGKDLTDVENPKLFEKEILEKVTKNKNLIFPKPITKSKLLDIMLNVRQVENQSDPKKYPLNFNVFRNTIKYSYIQFATLDLDYDRRRTIYPGLYIFLNKKEIPALLKERKLQ